MSDMVHRASMVDSGLMTGFNEQGKVVVEGFTREIREEILRRAVPTAVFSKGSRVGNFITREEYSELPYRYHPSYYDICDECGAPLQDCIHTGIW